MSAAYAQTPRQGHTPGPWRTNWNGVWKILTKAGWIVASIAGPKNAHGVFQPINVEANARLIAAAPELLAALDELLASYVSLVNSGDAGSWNPEWDAEVKAARAAIAKALGKAS